MICKESPSPVVSRRKFLLGSAMAGSAGLAAGGLAVPAWARGESLTHARQGFGEVSGDRIALTIERHHVTVGGHKGHAVAVNGSVPGPLLRLREGQDLRIDVTNRLDEDSSIHWHGLLLPFQFDGVPGVSFPGIKPGETFTYEFPIRQSGTYWWHSHSGLQEQAGHYGPIVIESATPDPRYDRDYVVLLSEFSAMHPHEIARKLKVGEHYFNYQMQTATDGDMPADERLMWGGMRMNPRDISDVTGSTYTFLVNGHGPMDGLEYLFTPGERVRLRVINGSAMTFFNVRIPGVPMTVIAADGMDVAPVEVDEFQIGVAETYDVIVAPPAGSHALVAEAMDRSGMGLASLTSSAGTRAAPPPLREPVTLTMADMGMGAMDGGHGGAMKQDAHGGMNHAGMDHASMGHGAMSRGASASTPAMNHGSTDHGGMDHSMRDTSSLPRDVKVGPGLDMVAPMPMDRMDYPGLGLDTVDYRVLRYTDLRAARANPHRMPTRQLEIHLTGNMERYMWSFDGRKFSAVNDDPIRFAYDERVRVKLVNDTMMAHPIHLHGHFFELVNGAGMMNQPLKHTVVVQPGSTATFDVTANEPGDWAFHCHLLYHMHAGMMQTVTVRPFPAPEDEA
ncbi:copper resistance system multicopper oxidase [Qipengyuania sp. GH1]|uniref:copper resistance system multicopper oxidase n=1 Tax=Qipengyuania aestuarii TaxID=2867241 RepID=UPI001C883F59|nr:copper resistance system multicopper oxidase [Qipengyuania aestuarii]MBX7536335.1 copper resistance system multicopper oxidase [Qipengyuania aestuarii]